jgi:hypothetical protein
VKAERLAATRRLAARRATAKAAKHKVAAAAPVAADPSGGSSGTLYVFVIALAMSVVLLGIAATPPSLVGPRLAETLVRKRIWIAIAGFVIPAAAVLEWILLVSLGNQ